MQTSKQGTRTKHVLWSALAAASFLFIAGPGSLSAQDFPSKPITIIAPVGPAGIIDMSARIIGERLSKILKVPVMIENKAGGGGMNGSLAFLDKPRDGHTLLAASGMVIISNKVLGRAKTFDPRKDFLPIGYVADAPCTMSVAKNAPFQSYEEFVKYAKANPGKVRAGISALGGENHIMFEQILYENKIQCKVVPFPQAANMVAGILGGHLDWMCYSLPATMQYHKSGDVKIVLMTRRAKELPGVPSGADVGLPEISINVWTGFFAHSKIPKPAYDKLVAAVAVAAKDPEVAKKFINLGCNVDYKDPQGFSKLMDTQIDIFAKAIKEANIQVD